MQELDAGDAFFDACQEHERQSAITLEKVTCERCWYCTVPEGFENSEHLAWCGLFSEFIQYDDVPADVGCESFERR